MFKYIKRPWLLYLFTFLLVLLTLYGLGVCNSYRYVLVQPTECTPPTDYDGIFSSCYDVTNRSEIQKLQSEFYTEYIIVNTSSVTTHLGRDKDCNYPLLHVKNFHVIDKTLFLSHLFIVVGFVGWSIKSLLNSK